MIESKFSLIELVNIAEELKTDIHKINLIPTLEIYKYIKNNTNIKHRETRKKSKENNAPIRRSERVLRQMKNTPEIGSILVSAEKDEKDEEMKNVGIPAKIEVEKPNYLIRKHCEKFLQIAETLTLKKKNDEIYEKKENIPKNQYIIRKAPSISFAADELKRLLVTLFSQFLKIIDVHIVNTLIKIQRRKIYNTKLIFSISNAY